MARSSSTGRADPTSTDPVDTQRRKSSTERSVSAASNRAIPSTSAATRPMSTVRSPPNTTATPGSGVSRSRPTSQPNQKQLGASTIRTKTPQPPTASTSSRSPTPTSSAASSRRSSVVLDSSAYRYSLNVSSISRFPPPAASGSGANTILAATAAERERKMPSRSSTKDELGVDPSRASVSSTASSRSSSRMSSRYMAEEMAPQRRPVYLALPSDPAALGPWSNTGSTLVPQQKGEGKDKDKEAAAKNGEGARRNSKIMTSFPFPHPVTPRRRADRGNSDGSSSSGGAAGGLGAAWQRLLTAIFAGPYERQLNREEQEDNRITQSIIQDIAQRNSSQPHSSSTTTTTSYGTLPIPKPASPSSEEDPSDPYGYRRLAGPHLLPSYTTDLVARRRERRRARSRARFQCMASWTIWTVSVLLVIIVLVLAFSFLFPDRLDIPSHHDDGDDDEDQDASVRFRVAGAMLQWSLYRVTALVLPNTSTAS